MLKNIKRYNEDIKHVLACNDLKKLKNKSVLVIGINGLIGSALIDVLNYLNTNEDFSIKIVGTVRNKSKILDRFNSYDMQIYEQDINNKIEINEHIDYIINTASNSHPKMFSIDPVGTMVANFVGTKNLLDFAVEKEVERFLYVSSGEIYGQGADNINSFDENYCGKIVSTSPRSCYPVSKLSAETLCCSYSQQYKVDTVIARPCHVYGPTQQDSDSRASAQFILNVINNQDIVMKSEGTQIRSYMHVLDCATGLLTILLKGENCNAYNVANNNSILSIREMAEKIASVNDKKVVFDIPTEKEKSGYNPVTRSVLNGKKLEDIGWKPYFNFDDGILETINCMK